MARIGLVLGAGGLTGQAFHAGVLAAVQEHTGWDPRSATVVVGTSAGSGMGAYLRIGLSVADLMARITGRPLSDEGEALVARAGESGDWTVATGPRRGPQMPHANLLRRLATGPHRVRPEALLGVSVPPGRVDTETWAAALRQLTGPAWPSATLWICTVRVDDARRVVLGRGDAPLTDVATAVAASSAIPGYFTPVEIEGRRYLDGGAHSSTNADVLRREALDLVIVSSPMSSARGAPFTGIGHAARRHFRRRLGQEVRALARAGLRVVVFQPSGEDQAVMGANTMDQDRMARVAEQAHATTLRRLADGRLDQLTAPATGP